MPIRVRFAPSPTGYLHVGGARTLLFNYLYAKQTGGKLVLRIEDTDQARSTPEAERMIFEDIRKLNLIADESPHAGGSVGPYRQSERMTIYAEKVRELLHRNQAYYCFCKEEVLEEKRQLALKLGKPPHYDGTCAKSTLEAQEARIKAGEKAGVRFRAYRKPFQLPDAVKGTITFDENVVGDFFITRTPRPNEENIAGGIGMPVYNFCCVIDDALMGMTHIIRGDDHLSNTARQLQIYEAFGWKPPQFAHIAMVLGSDKQKLSKRNGDSSVHEYLNQGYVPEVLLNFLALLGWWPPESLKPKSGHPEILALDEMIATFSLDGLQKSPAVFDVKKLQWMNSQFLRAIPISDLKARVWPFLEAAAQSGKLKDAASGSDASLLSRDASWWDQALDLVKTECFLLTDFADAIEKHFVKGLDIEAEAHTWVNGEATCKSTANIIASEFEKLPSTFGAVEIENLQKSVAQLANVKGKQLFMPLRIVTTGKLHGPELKRLLPLIGKEQVTHRLRANLKALNLG